MGFSLKKIAKSVAAPVTQAVKAVTTAPLQLASEAGNKVGITSRTLDSSISKLNSAYSIPENLIAGQSVRQGISDWKSLVKSSGVPLPENPIDSSQFDLFKGISLPSMFNSTSGYSTSAGDAKSSNLPMILGIGAVSITVLYFVIKRK